MMEVGYGGGEKFTNSLGTRIFKQLQNDIINGKYQQGDYLTETKLSEELGVSRTPIREALKQLEQEGLLKPVPGRGMEVHGISVKDIEDIFTIRMMIEGLAGRWAAEKITSSELNQLKEILDLQEFYTSKGESTEALLKLDTKFHDVMLQASKSRPLMHTLRTFHHYAQKAKSASLETVGRAQKVFNEHKAIFQAISERNPKKAEKLTTEHAKNAALNILNESSVHRNFINKYEGLTCE